MTDWLGWTAYLAAYPSTTLTEAAYPAYAQQAETEINRQTFGRAELVDSTDTDAISALALLEGLMINRLLNRAAEDAQCGSGAIQSASNDGYSETYVAAKDLRVERYYEDAELARKTLGLSSTRWLIYTGGVYHRPGRR